MSEEEINYNTFAPLRIIGDVHGKHYLYKKLCENHPCTICVGDVGFDYSTLDDLDHVKHRIVAGNHDNYNFLSPHFLGDFGVYTVPDFGDVFFVRGGYSIDHSIRKEGINWFRDEELSYSKCKDAIQAYIEAKPVVVISHECPNQIKDLVPFRRLQGYGEVPVSKTSRMLDEMWNVHKPKLWVFGHYHIDWTEEVQGTKFTCLNILSAMDVWEYPK